MTLPKCPHCGKLLVGHLSKTLMAGREALEWEIIWLCPERMEPIEPIWVEVEERVFH